MVCLDHEGAGSTQIIIIICVQAGSALSRPRESCKQYWADAAKVSVRQKGYRKTYALMASVGSYLIVMEAFEMARRCKSRFNEEMTRLMPAPAPQPGCWVIAFGAWPALQ